MKLTSYEYVSEDCNGKLIDCHLRKLTVVAHLKTLYANEDITGYVIRTIRQKEDLDEEGINIGNLESMVEGNLPFLYVLVTKRGENGKKRLEYLEREFGLKKIRQFENG